MSIQITVTLILLVTHVPIVHALVTNCSIIEETGQTKDCPSNSEYRCVDIRYDHVREYCFCNAGLKYAYYSKVCVDINECSVEEIGDLCKEDSPTPNELGHCATLDACTLSEFNCAKASEPICVGKSCRNLNGGYECYCQENETLTNYGRNCTCKDGFTLSSDNNCYQNVCIDVGKCEGRGVCEYRDPPELFYCKCGPGYSGKECEYKVCPKNKEIYIGTEVEWKEEKVGAVSQIKCESINLIFVGIATRKCALNSVWLKSDYSQCVRDKFSNLEKQLLAMEQDTNIVVLQNSIKSVINGNNTSNITMLFPSEIVIVNHALETLVIKFIDIQKNPNAYSEEINNAIKQTPEVVVNTGSLMLSEDNKESWKITTLQDYSGERTTLANLVNTLEKFSDSVNVSSTSVNNSISEENLTFDYKQINKASSIELFPQLIRGNSTFRKVRVSSSLLQLIIQSCDSVAFSSLVFPTIKNLIPTVELYKPVLIMKENDSLNSNEVETAYLQTDVLSLNTRACKEFKIPPESIEIEFITQTNQNLHPPSKQVCAFWNLTTNSWSMQGVITKEEQLSNGNVKIICILSHLTSFAILLASHEPTGINNTIQIALSAVIASISILCLIASLVCYVILYLRTRKSSKNPFKQDSIFLIHINFCIALLLAFLTFIASSIAVGSNRIPCTILAAVQHYLWLSVFSWSLCEGIAIAWKIRFWNKSQRTWPYLIPLGWGLPIPVVLITVPLTRWYYVDPTLACWVSNTNHIKVLSFILPMVMIMPTNILFYIYTLVTIYRVKEKLESAQRARALIIGSLVLLPLLSLPWIIGVFYINEATVVFGYIFIILVASQGTFFFIAHVVRNNSIRDYVFKWKNPYEMQAKFQKLHSSSFKTEKISATLRSMEQDNEEPEVT